MNKNVYITTSIPYVNGRPHVGHALELVQADVLARYYRLIENKVRFQTGGYSVYLRVLRGEFVLFYHEEHEPSAAKAMAWQEARRVFFSHPTGYDPTLFFIRIPLIIRIKRKGTRL